MSKTQKIWLAIFLAMFVVPEVLWSPVVNVLYSLWQSGQRYPHVFRDGFLMTYRYEGLLKTIVTVQLIGILLSLVSLIKNRRNVGNILFSFSLTLILLIVFLAGAAFYLLVIFSPSFP